MKSEFAPATSRLLRVLGAVLLASSLRLPLTAQVRIAEVMPNNTFTLADEDGLNPDWVELHNTGTSAVDLAGWRLTADSARTPPWTFAPTNLPAGARLIVFASGRNRNTPGLPFHTDFTLDASGDRVLLISPAGTAVSELQFGPLPHDVSFGIGRTVATAPLVATNAAARFLVPIASQAADAWTGGDPVYNDSGWLSAVTGVGFDRGSTTVSGLMGYWNFDDAANPSRATDRSGGNNTGTLVRGVYTPDAGGFSGKPGDRAIVFKGDGAMNVPNAAKGAFDAAANRDTVTISLWVNGGDAQPSNDFLFWSGSNTDGSGSRSLNVHLPWSDSVIYWDTGCCDPNLNRVSISEPNTTRWKGRWNHYAFVKDGTRKQIWQNGRLLLESINVQQMTPIRSFFLGAMTATGTGGYHGSVDDLSLWSVALLPAQIAALAGGASPLDMREVSPSVTTDVSAAMLNVNASGWLRVPFQVANPAAFNFLTLRMRYNDGFVAHVNGREVARRNAPDPVRFDSAATAERAPGSSIEVEQFDIAANDLLYSGINWLAIHGLNRHATNPTFLLIPELFAGRELGNRVFIEPTPGTANGIGYTGLVAPVTFSAAHGFFANPFDLTLQCDTPDTSIVYTLDGSEPSTTNGVVTLASSVAVRITTTSIVRAAAFRDGFAPGPITTRTYLFPGAVGSQKRPAGIGTAWPSGHPTDFTMDSRVINGAKPGYSLSEALGSIPTLSIVTPQAGLFGSATGIYPNSGAYGEAWERAASMEWIVPGGAGSFQENVGLRIHGGISRDKGFTPKHGFTVHFRGRYGSTKLDRAIFPDLDLKGFDRLVLRAGSTDTWPCTEWDQIVDGEKRWYRKDSSYIRDQWVRDAQIAMGRPSGHGVYAHLYLNGIYWGLYNVCERPDDTFGALHFGGREEEWDAIADFAEVHAGNADAWNRMMSLAGADLSNNTNYFRLLGRNADGTRNPNAEVLLDVDNLIDYMILHIYITADDWPPHNWWAGRRRGPLSTGFKFYAWDQEISNNSVVKQSNSYGQRVIDVGQPNTPAYLYARCRLNAEFRMLFADHVQQHLFNNGALTPSNALARWNARIAEIDQAVVAESARWGDYQRAAKPYLREVEWMTNLLWMRNVYFPTNTSIALRRFRSGNLFPNVAAPAFARAERLVTNGFSVELTHTNAVGALYFTTDGSDPRRIGGTTASSARSYTGPIAIDGHTVIRARVRNAAVWSPIIEAEYFVPQDYAALQPTEIHYHPPDAAGTNGDEFEFLELTNTGNRPLDLSGLTFTAGIDFRFPDGSSILPGATFVLAANPTAFAIRFPGVKVDGTYAGQLANSGETLTLHHPAGFDVFSFAYDDSAPWPTEADGSGPSLQRLAIDRSPGLPGSWQAGVPTPGVAPDFSNLDTDGDGLPDAWEVAYGTDPRVPDADGDPDADGLNNLAEFRAGTDPRDAASALRLAVTTVSGQPQVELAFVAVSNRVHVIQRRLAPAGPWEHWKQFEPEPQTRAVRAMDATTDAGSRWYRLTVQMPLE